VQLGNLTLSSPPVHYFDCGYLSSILPTAAHIFVTTMAHSLRQTNKMLQRKSVLLLLLAASASCFTLPSPRPALHQQRSVLASTPVADDETDEATLQWDLLQKYHAKGSWRGVWSSYDYMGDMMDEMIASVDLDAPSDQVVQHTHTFVVGAKRSDCATCFDAMETKVLPVATYTPASFSPGSRPMRLASRSWVNGPTVLKSGAVATEIILAYGDARVRAVFQHAPVWSKDMDTTSTEGSMQELPPPQGLKIFRVTVSREALRDQPPTAETEAAQLAASDLAEDDLGRVAFYRGVPPFGWHKVWSGTSWTWGPSAGNRGWKLEQLEEGDDWHGSSPVEMWNLRLPGGLFLQSPRMITPDNTGLLRVAWMPNDNVLVRAEAGVLGLQPLDLKDEEDLEESTVFAFEPPTLASLRCDVLQKIGDLEGEPQFVKDQKAAEAVAAAASGAPAPASATASAVPAEPAAKASEAKETAAPVTTKAEEPDSDSGSPTISDVLQL
jgi:hypothetical protein